MATAKAQEQMKLDGVGPALKSLREQSGLTTEGLAQELSIDQSTLSKYENGRRAVPLSLLEKIAKVLEQPPVSVVAWCLKERFPELADPKTKVSQLLHQLCKEVARQCGEQDSRGVR